MGVLIACLSWALVIGSVGYHQDAMSEKVLQDAQVDLIVAQTTDIETKNVQNLAIIKQATEIVQNLETIERQLSDEREAINEEKRKLREEISDAN